MSRLATYFYRVEATRDLFLPKKPRPATYFYRFFALQSVKNTDPRPISTENLPEAGRFLAIQLG